MKLRFKFESTKICILKIGEIIHSVKYKSARKNHLEGKKVLIIGIGNSAVDVAVNLVNEGK